MIRVAAAQFLLKPIKRLKSFVSSVTKIVQDAAAQQVQLLVLPESIGEHLGELAKPSQNLDEVTAHFVDDFKDLFLKLAAQHNILILAGTTFVKEANGYYKRSFLFFPDGKIEWQDKMHLTPPEKASSIIPGKNYKPWFETDFGKIGIAICYDSEFPHLIKRSVKEGANLILVPSCTPTLAAYYRVSTCCRARAIENQCFVIQSCLLGGAKLKDWDGDHQGKSAIYSPCDKGFPPSGILAETKMNKPGIAIADLDFKKLDFIRKEGEVLNYQDHTMNYA